VRKSLGSATIYYRNFAAKLADDINYIQDDIRFVSAGGRLLTATDFSEIYAYCLSASESFLSKLNAQFLDEVSQRAVLNELHDSIMMFYLFESGENLWLLDPYLIELQNFLHQVSSDSFREKVRDIGEALRQLRLARAQPEFKEFAKLAASAKQAGLELDPDQELRIYKFIESIAPALVQLEQGESGSAVGRLKRLLKEGRLVIPSDLPDSITTGDPKTFDRWFSELSRRRREHEAQNVSDAHAVSVIYALNMRLLREERPRKIVLLTRSETMHTIMKSEVEIDYWGAAGGNVLRHPRRILALLDDNAEIVGSSQPDRQRQVVERWRKTFEPILIIPQQNENNRGISLNIEEITRRHIALIASVWKRYCAARATRKTIENRYIEVNRSMNAISTLIDPNWFNIQMRNNLDQLSSFLKGHHFIFGTLISSEGRLFSSDIEGRRDGYSLESTVNLHQVSGSLGHGGAVQIANAHGAPMPFRIWLTDPRLSNVLSQLADDPFKALSVITQENMLEVRDNGQNPEQEWYVAVGYVCSALGAWGATRRACELLGARNQSTVLDIAILYSRAIRNTTEELDELERICEILRRLRRHKETPISDQLRITIEWIKYEFIIAIRAMDMGRKGTLGRQLTRLKTVIPTVIKSLRSTPISAEQCELLNNIVYHSTQLRSRRHEVLPWTEINALLERLVFALKENYGKSWQLWPDNFVDTVAWVRLQLISQRVIKYDAVDKSAEKENIVVPLKSVSAHEHTSEIDLADFRRHTEEARMFFEGLNDSPIPGRG
jgi:hypothetical protein